MFQATWVKGILWAATVGFGVLFLLKVPAVVVWVADRLGGFSYVMSFDSSTKTEALAWSIVVTTAASVWALHFQRGVEADDGAGNGRG